MHLYRSCTTPDYLILQRVLIITEEKGWGNSFKIINNWLERTTNKRGDNIIAGLDHTWSIGTELRQLEIGKPEVSTPEQFRSILCDDLRRFSHFFLKRHIGDRRSLIIIIFSYPPRILYFSANTYYFALWGGVWLLELEGLKCHLFMNGFPRNRF